jgi:hypothetical protein
VLAKVCGHEYLPAVVRPEILLEHAKRHATSDIDGEKVSVVWDFTPDGSSVVVAAGPPNEHSSTPVLYPLGGKTTSRPRRVAGTPAGRDLWHARISPTGRGLAINAVVPKTLESSTLYVGDLRNGGSFVQVTDGTAFDARPQWSAEGALLYFTSDRGSPGNVFNVWAIRIDPERGQSVGEPFQVTRFRNPALRPAWGSQSRRRSPRRAARRDIRERLDAREHPLTPAEHR